MNTNKLIVLLLTGPFSMVLLLTLIKFMLRKIREQGEEDFRLKPGYGLYFAGLLISGMLIQLTATSRIAEAADILQKNAGAGIMTDLGKTAVLFMGLGIVWFFLCYLLAHVFTVAGLGIKKEREEMVLGNTYYFLIKSVLLIAFALLMSPGLALVLRWLMPGISVQFIH
ncbi:hypothetical protein ACFQZI_10385 [Mucilaginibacter lutimaris]|uniref:Uncharacterized protein n=1 Tax=Mucilaginibacter lutimaris TaxID=931629 RepID=A0ABW2ZGJ9_9SPHI